MSSERSATPRERFGFFAGTLREDGPERAAQFFPPETRERVFLERVEACPVHYADGDLAVVGAVPDCPEQNLWCFGVDRHHDQSIVGFPITAREVPDGGSIRAEVLSRLSLDEWMTVEEESEDFVHPRVRRRLQGQVGTCWLPEYDFVTEYPALVEADELEEAFVGSGDSKTIRIGEQTVTVEAAGELGREDLTTRRMAPHRGTILRVQHETSATVGGERYEQRTVPLQEGIHLLRPIGVVTIPETAPRI